MEPQGALGMYPAAVRPPRTIYSSFTYRGCGTIWHATRTGKAVRCGRTDGFLCVEALDRNAYVHGNLIRTGPVTLRLSAAIFPASIAVAL